jgi:hypothetical protein
MMPETLLGLNDFNLNDPSKLKILHGLNLKYVGIWWECMLGNRLLRVHKMHKFFDARFNPSGKRATTENTKKIHWLLCQNGFDGV